MLVQNKVTLKLKLKPKLSKNTNRTRPFNRLSANFAMYLSRLNLNLILSQGTSVLGRGKCLSPYHPCDTNKQDSQNGGGEAVGAVSVQTSQFIMT